MPYTMEQFLEESKQALLNSLTLEEKLKIVQEVPLEQRMSGIPPEQRLKDLDAEQLTDLLHAIQAQLSRQH